MLNKVLLIGNLGKDPEVRYTTAQKKVVTLSVATSKNWVSNNEKKEKTTWHAVNVWGSQADFCEKYLTKGSKVFVEGEVDIQSYEKDGRNQYKYSVLANKVLSLSYSNKQENTAFNDDIVVSKDGNINFSAPAGSINLEDIPF